MDKDQLKILAYLNKNAVGYKNRKGSEVIRKACKLITGGPTNDFVREKIRDMVLNHGLCIGSISWDVGYWIIVDEVELNRVIGSLEARSRKLLERAEKLRKNWRNRNHA